MTLAAAAALLQDAAAPEDGTNRLVGICLLAAAAFDVLLAFYFAFVKPPPDPKARKVLALALLAGALAVGGLGVAFLVGAIGG